MPLGRIAIQIGEVPSLNYPSSSITDVVAIVGKPEEIGKVFAGFQRHLFKHVA